MCLRRLQIGFAAILFGLAMTGAAKAGWFGYSELGIIKLAENKYEFIAPDGETIDDASLRYNAARTAKLLGFSHFLIEMPVEKPKVQKPKSTAADAPAEDPAVDAPKPLTSIVVYFYNSPRTRNGVKSIAVTDIFPEPPPADPVETPPPVEKKKPKAEAPVAPVVESATTDMAIEQTAPKKKQSVQQEPVSSSAAPSEVAVEQTSEVAVTKQVQRKLKKPTIAQAEPVSSPPVEPAQPAQTSQVNQTASVQSLEDTLNASVSNGKTVKPIVVAASENAADLAPTIDEAKPATRTTKRRYKKYILPGEAEGLPDGSLRVKHLGDLFN